MSSVKKGRRRGAGLTFPTVTSFLVAASSNTQQGSPWFTLVFFGAIFGAMYFLLLRPQRRRVKESQTLQSSLQVEDEVVLTSGIYGFVSGLEGDIVWLDVADGHDKERIELRVSRSAIARKITESAPAQSGK